MRGDDTRARIIEAARRLFYRQGFGVTSLGQLASESGVPKGNFYYHFRTRDDVLRAVLEARGADAERALARWEAELPDPRARLARFLDMITAEREELLRYGCPVGSLASELCKGGEGLGEQAARGLERYQRFIAAQLEALGHEPAAARALSLRTLARVQGAILIAHAFADGATLRAELDDIARWLDGLCPSYASSAPAGS